MGVRGVRGAAVRELFQKKAWSTWAGECFQVRFLDWQIHIRSRSPPAAAEARETPRWEDRRWSEDWAAEQHVQGVKKPITVNQASAASQGGTEGKPYPGSGPPELAGRVQHGGKSTGCHIHLDFYECFDSSPKGTPMTRWRVFIQACQRGKNEGKGYLQIPSAHREKILRLF